MNKKSNPAPAFDDGNAIGARLQQVVDIARTAGDEILDVYRGQFAVDTKSDGSPVTAADHRAHRLIENALRDLDPKIPLLSEESAAADIAARHKWRRFWLVDPLDGTREFIKRSGQFTVNIALIEADRAVLGVVHSPVDAVSYFAERGGSAYKSAANINDPPRKISIKKFDRRKVVMVASRSHSSPAVETYRARLAKQVGEVSVTGMGSSLKICLVAEGRADIYPRLGPTFEWDTAAAHCVLDMAGGHLVSVASAPLKYNKSDLRNPWFLAAADRTFDWTALADDLRPRK